MTLGLLCALLARPQLAQESSSASAVGRSGSSDVALRGVMIPIGFQGKKYSAMLQVAVDGSPLPDAKWELGASFVSLGQTPEDFSKHVVAGEPGAKVVVEFQVEFEPQPYAWTLTARETTAGQSATRTLAGNWPDPGTRPATVSPVVLLQPAKGAFVRGENSRGQGALAIADEDVIRTDLPTAVVCVVCRGSEVRDTVRVERKLVGAASAEFKTHELRPGQDRCVQIRDMIPPGTLQDGHFRYELDLVSKGGKMASGVRKFDAVGGQQGSGSGSK